MPLSLTAPPQFQETPPLVLEVKELEAVTLRCVARGSPQPYVTWKFRGQDLGKGQGQVQVQNGTLWIRLRSLFFRTPGSFIGLQQGADRGCLLPLATISSRSPGCRAPFLEPGQLQNVHSVSCRGLKHQGTFGILESKQQPRLLHCSDVTEG